MFIFVMETTKWNKKLSGNIYGDFWDVSLKKNTTCPPYPIFDEDSDVNQTIIAALHLGFKKMP